jgi:hypothetical protein
VRQRRETRDERSERERAKPSYTQKEVPGVFKHLTDQQSANI